MKLYSNEIVFRGHPDKLADQISDGLLDAYLKGDCNTRAGIETVCGKGKIFITGEVTSNTSVDVESVVNHIVSSVGYNSSDFTIINNIGLQSLDIAQGVDIGGAGDQGMMFGYSCTETDKYLPKAMVILQELSKTYDTLRISYPDIFYPDGKAQITGYYDDDFQLIRIKDFTISYQNCETKRSYSDACLKEICLDICSKYSVDVDHFLINPTGKFLIGGPAGDSGLTGRKIVVDSYHSFAPVGGGAFSGKDSTKVDRSGAYKARELAIRCLKENNLKWCEIQLSYAIGMAEPLAIYIDSDLGNLEVPLSWYSECTTINMINDLKLREPIFEGTAMFGHFGTGFYWDN